QLQVMAELLMVDDEIPKSLNISHYLNSPNELNRAGNEVAKKNLWRELGLEKSLAELITAGEAANELADLAKIVGEIDKHSKITDLFAQAEQEENQVLEKLTDLESLVNQITAFKAEFTGQRTIQKTPLSDLTGKAIVWNDKNNGYKENESQACAQLGVLDNKLVEIEANFEKELDDFPPFVAKESEVQPAHYRIFQVSYREKTANNKRELAKIENQAKKNAENYKELEKKIDPILNENNEDLDLIKNNIEILKGLISPDEKELADLRKKIVKEKGENAIKRKLLELRKKEYLVENDDKSKLNDAEITLVKNAIDLEK
ncbi:11609_t:CDS:2, partial [Ambispora gerdemannii]